MKDLTAEASTIRAQILKDADEVADDMGDAEEAKGYIKEVAEHGCTGGNCDGLVYTEDIHVFYHENADEIDNILHRIEEETGEIYSIRENMKRLGLYDLREFLAWFAYEVEAQEIIREMED
jgi:hypothetical protein